MKSVVSRLTSSIGKAFLAALLLFAAATPAFAELGCIEDAQAHAVEGSAADSFALSSAESDQDKQKSAPIGQGTHCAFSHCAHGLPGLPSASGSAQFHSIALTYPPLLADRLLAAVRDGPYHPPRA